MSRNESLVLLVLAGLAATYGTGLMWTGRNYSRPLGRGLTRGDDLRLQRAPAIYFRVLGAMVTSAALDGADLVFLDGFRAGLPAGQVAALQILGALLDVAALASAVWFIRLASRYKLFRWNKP